MTPEVAWWATQLSISGNLITHSVSLWPNDTIWRQRSGSTLAQVMACCLTAPSHYLHSNDWSSVKSIGIHIRAISQEMPQPSITKIYLKSLKFHSNFPGANELNRKHANFVLITKNKFLLKISPNKSGNQEMIWATQFFTMGGVVGDPWIWADQGLSTALEIMSLSQSKVSAILFKIGWHLWVPELGWGISCEITLRLMSLDLTDPQLWAAVTWHTVKSLM